MTKLDLTIGAKELKAFVNSLAILTEFNLDVKNDGIHIHAMDPSTISMVETCMPKNLFSKWKVTEGHINVDADLMRKALKKIKDKDKVSIKTIAGNPPKMVFTINTEAREIPYSETQNKTEKKEPEVRFTAQVTIPAKELKDAVSKVNKIDKSMLLIFKDKKLILFAKNTPETIRMEMPIKGEVKDMTTLHLNTKYILEMLRATKKDTNVKLGIKTDEPVQISYNTGSTDVKYWLAPRIEDEKEELIKEALHPSKAAKINKEKERIHS